MTPEQAAEIMDSLKAAYPRAEVSDETWKLYIRHFTGLDFEVAARAVDIWVRDEQWFPTIAEFRGAFRRARRDLESEAALLAARAADPEPPHTHDPEVAAMIQAALREWSMPKGAPDVELTEHPAGECADCRKPFDVLYSAGYGSVGPLCAKCQDARLRVAAKMGTSA